LHPTVNTSFSPASVRLAVVSFAYEAVLGDPNNRRGGPRANEPPSRCLRLWSIEST
jgi:hypothetical protein